MCNLKRINRLFNVEALSFTILAVFALSTESVAQSSNLLDKATPVHRLGRSYVSKKRTESQPQSKFNISSTMGDGVKMKEYFDSSGRMFAVTWVGFTHPDLVKILGTYWNDYHSINVMNNNLSTRRHNEKVETENVVVEKFGRMRMVGGRAYIPSMIPKGVDLNEIN